MLAEKGYLSEFTTEYTTLYCLPGYVGACMQKESIKKSRDMFGMPVGNVTFSANTELSALEAVRFWACNSTLLLYLWVQENSLSAQRYAKVKDSVRWCTDHYRVAFYDGDTLHTACLRGLIGSGGERESPELDATGIEAKVIILSKEVAAKSIRFHPVCGKVLVVDVSAIYVCDPNRDLPGQIAEKAPSEETKAEENAQAVPGEPETHSAEGILADDTAAEEPLVAERPAEEANTPATEGGEMPAVEDKPGASAPALTPQALLEQKRVPSDDAFCRVIHGLLSGETKESELKTTIVNAVLLARGAGLAQNCPNSRQLSSQLRLATNLMLDECSYSSAFLSSTFGNAEKDVPALTLAAYMYALLAPAVMYDYGLRAQSEQYLSD